MFKLLLWNPLKKRPISELSREPKRSPASWRNTSTTAGTTDGFSEHASILVVEGSIGAAQHNHCVALLQSAFTLHLVCIATIKTVVLAMTQLRAVTAKRWRNTFSDIVGVCCAVATRWGIGVDCHTTRTASASRRWISTARIGIQSLTHHAHA